MINTYSMQEKDYIYERNWGYFYSTMHVASLFILFHSRSCSI